MRKPINGLIVFYLFAFGANLFDSLKYPGTLLTAYQIIPSIALVFIFAIFIIKGKIKNIILISGGVASLLILPLSRLRFGILAGDIDMVVFDWISNLQYPLYAIFVTPLFGLNYLFRLNYEYFSVVVSALFFIGLIWSLYLQRKTPKDSEI